MMGLYCRYCGAPQEAGGKFCSACGKPVEGKPRRTGAILFVIAGLLIGAGVVAAAVWYLDGGAGLEA
ncbi:MAG TPA: hypothetical protein VK070_06090, partial [Acidimicrobiia bacterium]|nr:hypothetical protein [Acidimicrobiia bacterium]